MKQHALTHKIRGHEGSGPGGGGGNTSSGSRASEGDEDSLTEEGDSNSATAASSAAKRPPPVEADSIAMPLPKRLHGMYKTQQQSSCSSFLTP